MVSVDFILELPDVHSYGYDAILVAMNSVRKQAHFIPTTTTYTVLRAANWYQKNVWKLHDPSDAFISNHGLLFIAEFTQELYCLLGIKL